MPSNVLAEGVVAVIPVVSFTIVADRLPTKRSNAKII
jgi:hypothetical protein